MNPGTITKVPLDVVRVSIETRVNDLGLIEVVPTNTVRYHYDPVTLVPLGLLVEPEAENLIDTGDITAWTFGTEGMANNSFSSTYITLLIVPGTVYLVMGSGAQGE